MWCCMLLIAGLHSVTAQRSPRPRTEEVWLNEPIFGLTYRTSPIRYEKIPSWINKKCHLGGYELSDYAHASREGSEYFIVMDSSGQEDDPLGNSIWLKGAVCIADELKWTLSGVPPLRGYRGDQFTEGPPGWKAPEVCENQPTGSFCHYVLRSPAEEAVLRSLVQDGIQRAVKAFGKSQFRKKECSAEVIAQESDYPIVQQELRKFCSTPD